MAEKNSGERKKLSLSLEGKLSLKNSVTSKMSGSVTTNNRSGRNTVQVEVKRVKRNNDNKETSFKVTNETNSGLSAEEIASRSRQLKEGLAKLLQKQNLTQNQNT